MPIFVNGSEARAVKITYAMRHICFPQLLMVLFMLFTLPATAQINQPPDDAGKPYNHAQHKHVFRALGILATDTKFSLNINYELGFSKRFTVFAKAGPAVNRQFLGVDAYGNDINSYAINALASGELRCYLFMRRLEQHQKITRNHSAPYIGLEWMAVSKPLVIFNNLTNTRGTGYTASFFNIGWQQEKQKTWIAVFAGARLPGKAYDNSVDFTDLLHAGVDIGKLLQ